MMIDFNNLLKEFAAAGVANDGARFTALFAEDATYDDNFFGLPGGARRSRRCCGVSTIPASYRWEFHDAICDGTLGYAWFRFSLASKMPGYEESRC